MDYINNIIKIMQEKGISQKELCDRLCLPKSLFSNWKRGINKSYLTRMADIANVLGCSITDLYLKDIEESFESKPNIDFELTGNDKQCLRLFHFLEKDKQEKILDYILNVSLEV